MPLDGIIRQLVWDASSFDVTPDPERQARILSGLRSPDEGVRDLALEAAAACANPPLVEAILALVVDPSASAEARAAAAISLGPTLELCDLEGYDDDEDSIADPPLPEALFNRVQKVLKQVIMDLDVPALTRRRALEAFVRTGDEWAAPYVRAAWDSEDMEWQVTGVFCAGYVRSCRELAVKALTHDDPNLVYQAAVAVADGGIEDTGEQLLALAEREDGDREVRLAAIYALGQTSPEGALDLLYDLELSSDEELAEAAKGAIRDCHLNESLGEMLTDF